MAIEKLAGGYDRGGWVWNVDHDITAGTIGTTVTSDPPDVTPAPGTLNATFVVIRNSDSTIVRTIGPIELTQFYNLGRQVLYTNAVLVGVVMVQPKGTVAAFSLNPSTKFASN